MGKIETVQDLIDLLKLQNPQDKIRLRNVADEDGDVHNIIGVELTTDNLMSDDVVGINFNF